MQLRFGLAVAVATGCLACATTTTASADNGTVHAASSVDPPAAAPQVKSPSDAPGALRSAIAACDAVQSNAHRLPSEFFAGEQTYEGQRDQALQRDGKLRESKEGYSPRAGAATRSYADWIVACDLFFQSNRDNYAAAQDAEAAAIAKARPSAGTLATCKVVAGKADGCGKPFTGQAPLFRDGLWRSCAIEAGKPGSCGEGLEGQAVVTHEGLVRSCDLAAGKVLACSESGYDGAAVLPIP